MSKKIKENFNKKGFAIVKNVLNYKSDIKPVLNDLDCKLNTLIGKYFTTKEQSRLCKLPFQDRYFILTKKTKKTFHNVFNIRPPQKFEKNEYIEYFNPQSIFNLLKSKKILAVVQKIIGKEIDSNPIQTFRVKEPSVAKSNYMDGLIGRTPWHQDEGTMNNKGRFKTDLVTVWIPFTKTTKKNGCMLAVPGSNKFGLINHCAGSKGQVEIKNSELIHKNCKLVPLEAEIGDIIILNKRLFHCSLPNNSKNLRISMDLRYNKAGQPSGRESLPSFCVKSRNKKNIKLNNYQEWVSLWDKSYKRSLEKGYTFKYNLPIYKHSKKDYSSKYK